LALVEKWVENVDRFIGEYTEDSVEEFLDLADNVGRSYGQQYVEEALNMAETYAATCKTDYSDEVAQDSNYCVEFLNDGYEITKTYTTPVYVENFADIVKDLYETLEPKKAAKNVQKYVKYAEGVTGDWDAVDWASKVPEFIEYTKKAFTDQKVKQALKAVKKWNNL
jgi:DNA polymerase II small subunit/DNA polymerase delta subunit B